MLHTAINSTLRRLLTVRIPTKAVPAVLRARALLGSRPSLPAAPPSSHRPAHSLRCLASFSAAEASIKAEKKSKWTPRECPACSQQCFRPVVFHRHLKNCCPDLLDATSDPDLETADDATVDAWLAAARAQEDIMREQALVVAFRQRNADGSPLRQGPPEVAGALGLGLPRAERLLKAAMRAVPLPADPEPIEVIFEDADFIAINKPPHLITAPKHRYVGGSLVNRVIGSRGLEPAVLHRLDMNTTGVVLFAKARDVVPAVHAQFRAKTAAKSYLALVAGVPEWTEHTVDAPIGRSDAEAVARAVVPDGKPAATRFRVIAAAPDADLSAGVPGIVAAPGVKEMAKKGGGAALIACEPLTGRTHQIRVHLAATGHPILGDDLYGLIGPWLQRQALHAASLTIEHPRTKTALEVKAPLPEDFVAALAAVGLGHCVDEC